MTTYSGFDSELIMGSEKQELVAAHPKSLGNSVLLFCLVAAFIALAVFVYSIDQKQSRLREQLVELINANEEFAKENETHLENFRLLAELVARNEMRKNRSSPIIFRESGSDELPKLDAKVIGIHKFTVEIDKGTSHGLSEEHELDLLRGTVYVGRIKLVNVRSESSAGVVSLLEAPVKIGDIATTRFLLQEGWNDPR